MKSRTSFCNGTVLKKDITRFLPLWAIYTVVLLYTVFFTTGFAPESLYFSAVHSLTTLTPTVLPYAFACAFFLFGDLFTPRMSNMLHAFPLRRETWLYTHIIAGLLFGIVPNTLGALLASIFIKEQTFLVWLWFLVITGKFIFHFLLAVFCVMCVGNRIGHLCVFFFISYFSILVQGIFRTVYEPHLYGVTIYSTILDMLSPAYYWLDSYGRFFEWETVSLVLDSGFKNGVSEQMLVYEYRGLIIKDWIYLAVCIGLTIPMTIGTHHIYLRRKIESTGNFIIAKPILWIFLSLISMYATIIIPVIGYPICFFALCMLSERTVKVFHWKNWAIFGVSAGIILMSIGYVILDPFHIVDRIPAVEKIESVTLDYHTYPSHNPQNAPNYYNVTITDPDSFEAIQEAHQLALDERDSQYIDPYTMPIKITYHLKNGQTMKRSYYVNAQSERMGPMKTVLGSFEAIFGTNDVEEIKASLISVYAKSSTGSTITKIEFTEEDYDALFQALSLDAEQGTLVQGSTFRESGYYTRTMVFEFSDGETVVIELYTDTANTHRLIHEYTFDS